MFERRKVLLIAGTYKRCVLLLTDAPRVEIERMCRLYAPHSEKGKTLPYGTLAKRNYVKVLHDSAFDSEMNIEAIGYDECYDMKSKKYETAI